MLIGTHNSTSYNIDFNIKLFPTFSKWNILRKLAQYIPCVRNRILKLTLNQNINIFNQLNKNIRILQFNISYCEEDKQFYCSHTFANISFEDFLIQLNEYIALLHGNYIHVLISPDFENQNIFSNHEYDFLNLISKYTFYPYIIWYYKPINIDLSKYINILPLSKWNIHWYNTDNEVEFINKFNEIKYNNLDKCSGLFCTLTPNENNLINYSIEDKAKDFNPKIYQLIKDLPIKNQPYVLLFDFIEKKDN